MNESYNNNNFLKLKGIKNVYRHKNDNYSVNF